MLSLYTVVDMNSGDVIASSQTAIEAMNVILTSDGHQYEIRPEADGDGYRLWTSAHSRNSSAWSGLRESAISSLAADVATAKQDIAEQVIVAGWPGKPGAYTDESYAEMQAQFARYGIQALAVLNRAALIDTVKASFNCQKADVDVAGDIWIADPEIGRWLTGAELDKIIADCGGRQRFAGGFRPPYLERGT